jgi:hypothetical protein
MKNIIHKIIASVIAINLILMILSLQYGLCWSLQFLVSMPEHIILKIMVMPLPVSGIIIAGIWIIMVISMWIEELKSESK